MKILVLQLARLGDILQTWPALRALKRQYPDAEIHVLARARFREALDGLSAVTQVWTLESKEILRPLAQPRPDVDVAMNLVNELVGELAAQGFDQIINLSFSPVSSFLTRILSNDQTVVRGYTRHADGYLAIPDDASAYFYAQVGPDRPNRIHLSDLLAHISGVELLPEDWRGPDELSGPISPEAGEAFSQSENSIVVHVGASQAHKTLGWTKWAQIVRGLVQSQAANIVLIGSESESQTAAKIVAACGELAPHNLVGKTKFSDLFTILRKASLLVGGDSGPLHIASLVGTASFNLSFPVVSFWETGPRAARSRVISVEDEAALPSDVCVQDIVSVWREIGDASQAVTFAAARTLLPSYVIKNAGTGFVLSGGSSNEDFPCSNYDFQWSLTRAVYMGESFPMAPSEIFVEAVRRLVEANGVALHQLKAMERIGNRDTSVQILDRVDEVIEQIARMVPDIAPLVRWFQTERLRMGPMPVEELISATRSLHLKFEQVLSLYHLDYQPDLQDDNQAEQDQTATDRKSERVNEA